MLATVSSRYGGSQPAISAEDLVVRDPESRHEEDRLQDGQGSRVEVGIPHWKQRSTEAEWTT